MDITSTAQTLQHAQELVQGAQAMASQIGWGHVILAAVCGVASIPAGQAFVEHWTSGSKIPARVKALTPSALALGLGYLSTRFHVTPEQATAAATLFAGGMHLYNETALAAVTKAPETPK